MAQNRYYSSTAKPTVTTVDPGVAGTTLTVVDTTSYSGLDSTFPYTLAVNWGLGDQELMSVTARPSGTTFTVTRGVGGTTAVPHGIGATVFLSVYEADFTEAAAHRGSNGTPTTTGVHGVSGNVVGTTDTQTLANKTVLHAVNSYSANHTAGATEEFILASASGGSITITLPTAVGITGQTYTIKRSDSTTANTVTVATTSSQTIDGATTYTRLWDIYTYIQVISDGANWAIADEHDIPEPWQSATLASQWSQRGAGFPTLKYRRLPYGTQVQWDGDCTFTANGTTGLTSGASIISAVPSTYRPTNEQHIPAWIAGGTGTPVIATNRVPLAAIDSAGVLKVFNITSNTTNTQTVVLEFNGIIGLDS